MAQNLWDYWIISDAIGYAAASAKVIANIPAKTLVTEVICVVTEAYVTSDNALVDIGDKDAQADDWVDQDNITDGTIGMYKGTTAAGAAYAGGHYYASAGQITATVAGTNSAGEAYALIHCLSLPL